MLIPCNELVEARLIVRREQRHPSRRNRLVVEPRRSKMRGIPLNAVSNQIESLIERISMQQQPR